MSNSSASDVIGDDEDFFRFTRGRFVSNETYEMAQRYVRFNTRELGKVAAAAVNSPACVGVRKYADGMHNKAFLLTMSDGQEAVAKVPNPNAGRPHFTTASEVATMDFLRNVLNTPVPEVYAWSSQAQASRIDAEYIIMEKVNGVSLNSVWPVMGIADRFKVVKAIAGYQKAWNSAALEGYGSIYYAAEFEEQDQRRRIPNSVADQRNTLNFALGPTTCRDSNDHGRLDIDFDRGPWTTALDYLTAIGHREMVCVNELPRLPDSAITLSGPGTYQVTRRKKIRALHWYLDLIQVLCPDEPVLRRPCIWHCDLHGENIFVNPTDPTEVVGIIDLQSTEVAPAFMQVRQPYFIDHEGTQAKGLKRPRLPPNLSQLASEDQHHARRMYVQQSLCVLYRTLMHGRSPEIWKCFEFQETDEYDLLLLARNLLVHGEATYMARLLELAKLGTGTIGLPCKPLLQLFGPKEQAEIQDDLEGALRGMTAMQRINESLGELFPERGVVRPENYSAAKSALREAKEQTINEFAHTEEERVAWARSWPFDD